MNDAHHKPKDAKLYCVMERGFQIISISNDGNRSALAAAKGGRTQGDVE